MSESVAPTEREQAAEIVRDALSAWLRGEPPGWQGRLYYAEVTSALAVLVAAAERAHQLEEERDMYRKVARAYEFIVGRAVELLDSGETGRGRAALIVDPWPLPPESLAALRALAVPAKDPA